MVREFSNLAACRRSARELLPTAVEGQAQGPRARSGEGVGGSAGGVLDWRRLMGCRQKAETSLAHAPHAGRPMRPFAVRMCRGVSAHGATWRTDREMWRARALAGLRESCGGGGGWSTDALIVGGRASGKAMLSPPTERSHEW